MNILSSSRFRHVSLVALFAVFILSTPSVHAQVAGQDTYDKSEAAVAALSAAIEASDADALGRIFGPDLSSFQSGDKVADANDRKRIATAMKVNMRPVSMDNKRVVLYIGALNWPFPIPIVKNTAGKWFFDTAAGREEYLNRRIGRNELATILVMEGYVEAQAEYALEDRDADGVLEYAQKGKSTDGAKDGLFWPTAAGETSSPLGDFVTFARAEGYSGDTKTTFHGYVYRILTRQGRSATGGAMDYVVDGNMTKGFALIAYPATWGSSGIMTFVVGPDGRVFEKNLGPKTADLGAAITDYSPDKTWSLSGN